MRPYLGCMSAKAPTVAPSDIDAFDLGWDYGCHRVQPPSDLTMDVQQGYNAALAQTQPHAADRFVRKWLLVRANALRRGMPFDSALTPEAVRGLDVPTCPVTGETLTHGAMAPSDWSVDRVLNDRGYLPGNMVMMSTRANRAKADLSTAEIITLALDEASDGYGGLSRGAWISMAELVNVFSIAEHDAPPRGVPRLFGQMIYPGLRLSALAYWQTKVTFQAVFAKDGVDLHKPDNLHDTKATRRAAKRLLAEVLCRARRYAVPYLAWRAPRMQRLLDDLIAVGGPDLFAAYKNESHLYFSSGLQESRRRLDSGTWCDAEPNLSPATGLAHLKLRTRTD